MEKPGGIVRERNNQTCSGQQRLCRSSSMADGIAVHRLRSERKMWRKDHPAGFVAKPVTVDGVANLLQWRCVVPGKEGTDWEGGAYALSLTFSADYPSKPPVCRFTPPIFHPNVYPDGKVCLSIINPPEQGGKWRAATTLKQVLCGIQDLLDAPNNDDPANGPASNLLRRDPHKKGAYKQRIEEEARKFPPAF